MKKYTLLFIATLILIFNSCTNSQTTDTNLAPTDFSKKLSENPESILIDVRTPEEFASGHLENSRNFDWNGDDFNTQISTLDKTKPVYVYCLSGGRSGKAASQMRSDGFKEVYELNGGILNWRNSNLPETKDIAEKSVSDEMSIEKYNQIINSDKLVLVDFYAEWCGPCKKMKPILEEISTEMNDKMTIIRIDVDENPLISKELKIESLPTLLLYNKSINTWKNIGFISKEEIVEHLH